MVPALTITRSFAASREALFKALSDASQLERWWGTNDYPCGFYKTDFKVGGKYFYSMVGANGEAMHGTGVFTKITKPSQIVYTDSFADAKGNVINGAAIGMPGDWPDECVIDFKLSEMDKKTILTLTHSGIPEEMRENCTKGWGESFDRLDRLMK